ncbi:hypothetical protein FISHEDRAFT_56022 [Fistulina hepatica ATCC 64428]|uniref:Uncharacterized protein n=1 Tax=Fistulina hepatica ATCC 64428 TaxID=1128425 RepID=A0A0D7ALT9_9AGAR|nr:hypothetical protein FISHEDRAFT_56022 [Fistulina hepatica ATCC 64428]
MAKLHSLTADHIVEAQTVANAMNKHRVSKSSSLMQFQSDLIVLQVKTILNDKENLALLSDTLNKAKAMLFDGKNMELKYIEPVQAYLEKHSKGAHNTSVKLQKLFEKSKFKQVDENVAKVVNKHFPVKKEHLDKEKLPDGKKP